MTDPADLSEPVAPLTRDRLLELAAEVFAAEGYASVSVRDLARRTSLTTGAIYAHFLNKADLLVEAIDARVASGVDAPRDIDTTFHDYLVDLNRRYGERADLRALLLEGATAARSDPVVRDRLAGEQNSRLRSWVSEYEAAQEAGQLDQELDMRATVLMLWAIELGVGVLEALAIELPDPDAWAELTSRFVRSIEQPTGPPADA